MSSATKSAAKGRYLLWIAALLCVLAAYIYTTMTKMLPAKYVVIVGVVIILIFSLFFWWQRKGKIGKFIFIGLLEIVMGAGSLYELSVMYHANHMLDRITENTTESEVVAVYVKKEKPWNTVEDVLEQDFGMVAQQSTQSVDAYLNKIAETADVQLNVSEYAGMFDAVDAFYEDEVQVLVIDDAYAGMIPEVEGYEWFYDETKLLGTSLDELVFTRHGKGVMVASAESSVAESSMAPEETATTEETQNSEETTESKEKESGKVKKETKPPKMELMEPPEQVDWTALVNQDLITVPDGSFVMYISGADTWGQASTKSRSDVNIIAAVNTNTKKVLLVSTPRDYYVPLSVSNGVKDKLTHAGLYGINCSMDTLGALYGVSIPYYVKMNFTGFVNIVNAVGGVDVYSETDFTVEPEFHYVAGNNHLDGIQTLAFARERYSFAGGDRARGTHQMEVIRAVINKCMSPAILGNYADVMNGVSGSFTTNMSKEKIASLVRMQLNDMAGWDIQSISVDGSGANKTTYSVSGKSLYVMIPNESSVQNAKDRIASVLNGN